MRESVSRCVCSDGVARWKHDPPRVLRRSPPPPVGGRRSVRPRAHREARLGRRGGGGTHHELVGELVRAGSGGHIGELVLMVEHREEGSLKSPRGERRVTPLGGVTTSGREAQGWQHIDARSRRSQPLSVTVDHEASPLIKNL